MGANHQALLMRRAAAGLETTITWNPADKNPGVTLSNGNKTATGAAVFQLVRSATGKSAGKWYFEVTVVTAVTFGAVGIAKASTPTNTWVGGDASSYGIATNQTYTNGASTSAFTTVTDGNVVGVAVDLDAGRIWFAVNNTWIDSSDPATNTSPRYTGLSGTYYPASSPGAAAHTINATFSYAPPSGFSAWT